MSRLAAVSVLIPCRNAAAYLADTLASVLNQTLPPSEVIVVDDGSTDGSRDIVAGYGGAVTLLFNPGRGASAARNHASSAAHGEFLQFLDADDLLEPGALEARVAALQQSNADVAISNWCRIADESGLWRVTSTESGNLPSADLPADVQIMRGFWAPPAAILYRRTICERIGGWRETLPVIQDARFLLDAARVGGRFVHVNRVGARYRQHVSGSLSTSNSPQFWGDVLRNAREVEGLWRASGRHSAVYLEALGKTYDHCARAALPMDQHLFTEALDALSRLGWHAATRRVRAARLMNLVFGYRLTRAVLHPVRASGERCH